MCRLHEAFTGRDASGVYFTRPYLLAFHAYCHACSVRPVRTLVQREVFALIPEEERGGMVFGDRLAAQLSLMSSKREVFGHH